MKILKSIARALFSDYGIYKILMSVPEIATPPEYKYTCRRLEDVKALNASDAPDIRGLVNYAQDQAICFISEEGGAIAAACWYWYGDTYKRRNFWPLKDTEAKLVQITTAPPFRGRGIAQELLRYSAKEMFKLGFASLYARVWHSHVTSLRAFERAGWTKIAWVIEIELLGRRLRLSRSNRATIKKFVTLQS